MPTTLADEDSLIRSGILDSSALFELILWIEEKTGKPLDPTHFDFLAEFDSIDGIAHYLEAGRSG
jgi:acyl carrier protein